MASWASSKKWAKTKMSPLHDNNYTSIMNNEVNSAIHNKKDSSVYRKSAGGNWFNFYSIANQIFVHFFCLLYITNNGRKKGPTANDYSSCLQLTSTGSVSYLELGLQSKHHITFPMKRESTKASENELDPLNCHSHAF